MKNLNSKIKKIINFFPIVGLIILIYILSTIDLAKILEVFSKINPFYSFLALFSVLPVVLLSNIQWQILLKKQKINVSFFYSLKNIFIGYFYGFITPGGFGAYTRSLYLKTESGCSLPKCVSNIIIFNTIDFLSLLLLGIFGGLILGSLFPSIFFALIFVFIIVVFLFLFFLKKDTSKFFFKKIIQKQFFSNYKDRLSDSIDDFYRDLPGFKDVFLPFLISVFGWLVRFSIFFLISRLFLVDVEFYYFILIVAVANFVGSIPVSIYGLGTRDAALISLLSVFGVYPEKVLALSLFWFAVIWLCPSVIGALITFFETRCVKKSVLSGEKVENFTRYMERYPELYRHLVSYVEKYLDKKSKSSVVLDLGCGPGLLLREMEDLIYISDMIGLDKDFKMLEMAKEKSKKPVFIQGFSDNIPLKDDSCDVIVSRFSLTYWNNPLRCFSEIKRVLKPGGFFVLEALNRDFSSWKLFLIRIHMSFKFAGSDVVRYHVKAYDSAFRKRDILKLLDDEGFIVKESEGNVSDWRFIFVAKNINKKIFKQIILYYFLICLLNFFWEV